MTTPNSPRPKFWATLKYFFSIAVKPNGDILNFRTVIHWLSNRFQVLPFWFTTSKLLAWKLLFPRFCLPDIFTQVFVPQAKRSCVTGRTFVHPDICSLDFCSLSIWGSPPGNKCPFGLENKHSRTKVWGTKVIKPNILFPQCYEFNMKHKVVKLEIPQAWFFSIYAVSLRREQPHH